MVGKWHVTPLTEAGATGPFDGWPLGRGFDRFYGFMDAETDQYAPDLVRDNSSIDPPGSFASGYHLTADLVDQSIGFLASHAAEQPDAPWVLWLALGACHAPHQAPLELIRSYDEVFADGWDIERDRRIARQKTMGIVPPSTRLPPRNDGVQSWESHSADERRFFTRLQAAFAAMLDHADQQLARLVACDLAPTLLDIVGVAAPPEINGVRQMPIEGTSFAASLKNAAAPAKTRPQYFEMFGHRGLWHAGWKAVAYHPPGTPYDNDRWELFHLDEDFSETNDLAAAQPERLAALVKLWWEEAAKHQVLPLDDRFRERFLATARRLLDARKHYVFHAGMGHVPTDVAPDLRSRSYSIEAHVETVPGSEGVLIAHGDATSGYSLYVDRGYLVHDMNIGGEHVIVRSDLPVPGGKHRLGLRVRRLEGGTGPGAKAGARLSEFTLLVDGKPAGTVRSPLGFYNFISWTGLDIGRDRGSPVSQYQAPFEFTGKLIKVTVTLDDDQALDGVGVGRAQMARE
jgi:hypothetical protein